MGDEHNATSCDNHLKAVIVDNRKSDESALAHVIMVIGSTFLVYNLQ